MDCVGCDKCRLWGKLQVQCIFCVYVRGGGQSLEDKHLFPFGRMPFTLAFRLSAHGWSLIHLPIYKNTDMFSSLLNNLKKKSLKNVFV